MWLPKSLYHWFLSSIGQRFDALDQSAFLIDRRTLPIERILETVVSIETRQKLSDAGAEIVAHKLSEDIRERFEIVKDLDAIERENTALRSRVVQQETTIKLLLQNLEIAEVTKQEMLRQLGLRINAPVMAHQTGAPTILANAPAGVTDETGAPRAPQDADDAMKMLQRTIQATQGGSAPPPTTAATPYVAGEPGDLPENLFEDPDGADDVPASV